MIPSNILSVNSFRREERTGNDVVGEAEHLVPRDLPQPAMLFVDRELFEARAALQVLLVRDKSS